MIKLISALLAVMLNFFPTPKADLVPVKTLDNPSPVSTISAVPKEFSTGPSDKPRVALTFDADMTAGMKRRLDAHLVSSWYNQEVINILEKNQTKATLFLTGMWVEVYPKEAKALAQNPLFEIGSHSYSHPAFHWPCYTLRRIGQNEKGTEIDKTQAILKSIGVENSLFRFPGGCHSKDDSDLVNSRGISIVNWDVSSTDAFNQNTDRIVKGVVGKVKNGSIVVFHLHGGPNAPKTAPALEQIIPKLKDRGFEFVQVSEFFR